MRKTFTDGLSFAQGVNVCWLDALRKDGYDEREIARGVQYLFARGWQITVPDDDLLAKREEQIR